MALYATDSVTLRGMRLVRSVHKFGYGHKFEVQAVASIGARGAQARDRSGIVCAGASVSIVARQYDVDSNQVFAWRKLYGDASTATPDP